MEKEIEDLKIRINNYSRNINYDQYYLANEIFNDDEKRERFLEGLDKEFQRIESLVLQANTIANEMGDEIIYKTVLHTPVSYFKPTERNLTNLCEIGVEVKYEDLPAEIWDREKFQWKLREIEEEYNRWKASESEDSRPIVDRKLDSLIGVANIYLKALFYNSKFDYIVPIINTEGKICGSLHVVLDSTESSSSMKTLSDFQINSSVSDGIGADIDEQSLSNSQPSLDEGIDEFSTFSNLKNEQITVKFAIKEARDLPKINAGHILCRYAFINPNLDQTATSIELSNNENQTFTFDHENEFTFSITEDFLLTCQDGSVSIEVWSQYKPKKPPVETEENAKVQKIGRRWRHVKRNVQFSIEIQELDTAGQWNSVEINTHEKIITGGIYRLKQGQSKRVIVRFRVLPRSDSIPFSFHAIRSVEIGSINTRKLDAPRQLDSYQEEDLTDLKCHWLELLDKQRDALVAQMSLLNQQTDKTSEDSHREKILLNQLLRLTEEQNIAMFPPVGSGIPGAPACWDPPKHVEQHRPLLFLNTNEPNEIAGLLATLPEETEPQMRALPLIQQASDEIRAVALWDPSIHQSHAIDQVTAQDTIVYLIIKVNVLIDEPVPKEIILRKRIAVTISKPETWWPGKILKTILNDKPHKTTSVVYDIVSTIPRMIFAIENSQSLSQKSIEKYLQHASAIDSVLLLDKLRQEVLLAEKSAKRQPLHKSTSAPHIIPEKIEYEPIEPVIQREPDLSSSTSSLISRMSFLEGVQPIQTPTFRITRTVDLEVDQEENNEHTLELKYLLSPEQIIEHKPRDYSIGCRVIVNTGQSVVNKPGAVRFIGEIAGKDGKWYGIELDEPIGKNNGSLEGNIYFHCSDKHGVFVRRDKLRFVD